MNFQLNLGLYVFRFSFVKRVDTLTIKHNGVKYYICPQVERPERLSVFKMNRFSSEYICPLGRKDTQVAKLILPEIVYRQALDFMSTRLNKESTVRRQSNYLRDRLNDHINGKFRY